MLTFDRSQYHQALFELKAQLTALDASAGPRVVLQPECSFLAEGSLVTRLNERRARIVEWLGPLILKRKKLRGNRGRSKRMLKKRH